MLKTSRANNIIFLMLLFSGYSHSMDDIDSNEEDNQQREAAQEDPTEKTSELIKEYMFYLKHPDVIPHNQQAVLEYLLQEMPPIAQDHLRGKKIKDLEDEIRDAKRQIRLEEFRRYVREGK